MYKLNYFNFKKLQNKYLITNDLGKYEFLSFNDFDKLVNKKQLDEIIENKLIDKGFIFKDSAEVFSKYMCGYVRNQKEYLFQSTVLHIFVVTKNCNFNCVYCQAGNLSENCKLIMSKEIAKKAVDIALQSPSEKMTFEFQGGEPLLNYDIIKFIIEYTNEKKGEKQIDYCVVSNLTKINNEMIKFFKENNVAISTSIDGNRELQNINRPYAKHDSYYETIKGLKLLKSNGLNVGAIQTTTRYSLDKYKEIVDEYIQLGFKNIFVRPLTQLGKADSSWEKIGYSAEEFIEFYKKILEYIIEKNKEGHEIAERHCDIFLRKILANAPLNYMELRSPCGGSIGQMAYYYDGNIYTCDEGRMLAEMGNQSFKIGNVNDDTYSDLINSNVTSAMCVSSCLECLNKCESCVYMPFCGTCPVVNLAQENNIFSRVPENYRCKIYKGMMEIIFGYLERDNREVIEIFEKWIED